MADSALVAVLAEPNYGFFDTMTRLWEVGDAILPVDPRLPAPRVREILERFRPARFVRGESSEDLPDAMPVSDEIRAVVLTSGSSGEPKGVELSLSAFTASWAGSSDYLGAGDGDVWLCCLPAAHIAGLSVMVRSMMSGKQPVIQEDLDLSLAKDATLVSLVPTQLSRLLEDGADLSRFKAVLLGGGRISERLLTRANEAGVRTVTTYGMTETCGGCVYDGHPLEGVDVSVDDQGTVSLRGEVLFRRYRNEPQLTRKAMRGGWFITNDLGFLGEDGTLTVMGRADDVIISGGEKVAAAEVESIIFEHPRVLDCAVAGLSDDEWGEVVAVAVVPLPGAEISLEDLRAFVKERAAPYKAPRQMVTVEAIPRTQTGKPLKTEIQALF